MIKILLPVGWTHHGNKEFEAAEGLLPDVIRDFAQKNPRYRWRLLNAGGEIFGYLNIILNDELVPSCERATASVPDGATVVIFPPLSGG